MFSNPFIFRDCADFLTTKILSSPLCFTFYLLFSLRPGVKDVLIDFVFRKILHAYIFLKYFNKKNALVSICLFYNFDTVLKVILSKKDNNRRGNSLFMLLSYIPPIWLKRALKTLFQGVCNIPVRSKHQSLS